MNTFLTIFQVNVIVKKGFCDCSVGETLSILTASQEEEEVLYTHIIQLFICTYICAEYILTQWIKTNEDFYKKIYLSLYCKVCVWEGVGDRTELQYIDPHSYGHQRCVFLVLLMLNRRPGGPLCWLSLLHLITNWPGPQTPSGVPRAPSAWWWLSPPHLSPTRLISNSLTCCLHRVI